MPPLAEISGNRQRRSETTLIDRVRAEQMRLDGYKWSKIAEVFGRPESTLRKLIKGKEFNNLRNKARSGRPKVLTEHDKRAIWRKIHQDHKIEYKELLPAVGLTLRQKDSVYRYLKQRNVHKWIAKTRPLLT